MNNSTPQATPRFAIVGYVAGGGNARQLSPASPHASRERLQRRKGGRTTQQIPENQEGSARGRPENDSRASRDQRMATTSHSFRRRHFIIAWARDSVRPVHESRPSSPTTP